MTVGLYFGDLPAEVRRAINAYEAAAIRSQEAKEALSRAEVELVDARTHLAQVIFRHGIKKEEK
jgi:hypothetical protein